MENRRGEKDKTAGEERDWRRKEDRKNEDRMVGR